MPSSNPGRPPNERDLVLQLNGCPMFPPLTAGPPIGADPATGILTSTGTAVNNVTTATPFAVGALQADGVSRALLGSLAGRVLLVSATAAGFLLASQSPVIGQQSQWTVATQTTIPPVAGTFPGVNMAANDVREITMLSTTGWLQWISATGTASLIVWELF